MTPPKLGSVDVSATRDLHLEIFSTSIAPGEVAVDKRKLELANELAKQLEGSDLYYDPETVTFAELKDGKTQAVDIIKEATFVRELARADADQDGTLTEAEVQDMLVKYLGAEESSQYDVKKFLGEIEGLMANRYRPIAKNMEAYRSQLKWKPTLDAIKAYNHGLMLEDIRQSQAFLHPNGWSKSMLNIPGFVVAGTQNSFLKGISLFTDVNENSYLPMLPFDEVAFLNAVEGKNERDTALLHLERALSEGHKQGLDWYQDLNLSGLLDYMANKNEEFAESARILQEELPLEKLHDILRQEDPEQIWEDLLTFAAQERPQFMGAFGGGNTNKSVWGGAEEAAWYNLGGLLDDKNFNRLLGNRHNLYFANSVFSMMVAARLTDNDDFNAQLRDEAMDQRKDMMGDGGGFANLIWSTLIFSHERKDWSDVNALDGVGQVFNALFWFWQGPKVYQGLKDLGALRHTLNPHALVGLAAKWLRNSKPWKLNFFGGMGSTATREAIHQFNVGKAWGFWHGKGAMNMDDISRFVDDFEGLASPRYLDGSALSATEIANMERAPAGLFQGSRAEEEGFEVLAEHGRSTAEKIRQAAEAGKFKAYLKEGRISWADFSKALAESKTLSPQEWQALDDGVRLLIKDGEPYATQNLLVERLRERYFSIPGTKKLSARMNKAEKTIGMPLINRSLDTIYRGGHGPVGSAFTRWMFRLAGMEWTQQALLPNTAAQAEKNSEGSEWDALKSFNVYDRDHSMNLRSLPDPTEADPLLEELE